MTPFQERDAALRGLVLGFKLAAAALANPLASAAALQDEALLADLAASPPLLSFHPLNGLTIPKGQAAANAPARPRRAGQAVEPLPPTRTDAAAPAPEPNPPAARTNAPAPAYTSSAATVPSAPHEMPPVFRLSRRPLAEASPTARGASAEDAASWSFENFAPGDDAAAVHAGEALHSIEALVEAILAGPAASPSAPEGRSETSRGAAPPAAMPLPAGSGVAPMPPLAIDQLDAAARAALAALTGRSSAAPRAAAAPSKPGRAASSSEMAAPERLARPAPQARSPQARSLVIPELDAVAEPPAAPAAPAPVTASAPLDADALAALVNAALVEQARRYGVDLS